MRKAQESTTYDFILYHILIYLNINIYKISCLTHAVIGQLPCINQAMQTRL